MEEKKWAVVPGNLSKSEKGNRWFDLDVVQRYCLYFENAKEALVPPNPKLFDIETLTFFCCAERGT
jgi:hypothetical protein